MLYCDQVKKSSATTARRSSSTTTATARTKTGKITGETTTIAAATATATKASKREGYFPLRLLCPRERSELLNRPLDEGRLAKFVILWLLKFL